MKTLLRAILAILMVVLLALFLAFADGASLPVNHVASVTGTIAAPPDKVFTRITNVARAPSWRPEVKAVTLLAPDAGRDHWIEDLGHGQTMTFLATRTDTPNLREVRLNDPAASYGGTWLYELSPGTAPNTTTLKITETGFIRPPLYRFIMTHIMKPTYNLDIYMRNMQAAAPTL